MSNQTTPQASDLSLPLVFNDAAKEDACAGRWNACVECADGFSFCETFGFDKEEAESRARLVVQAVNEREKMLAAVQPTQQAAEQWLREHFKISFGDPEGWTEAQYDQYHAAIGMAYAMVCDLELTVKQKPTPQPHD